jgi:hypothetical protein
MKAYVVPAKIEARIVQNGKEWGYGNIKTYTTTKKNMFFEEDIRVDPIGKIACHKGYAKTIGGSFAASGYYGFERDGWVLLVHAKDVQIG